MRIALLLAGVFGAFGVAPVAAGLPEELANARERWAERGSEHYSFTISNGCYCAPADRGPVTVTVVRGEAAGPSALEPFKISSLRITIPALFDQMDQALRRLKAAYFQFEFDPLDGHPTRIAYDDPAIDDDQWVIVVADLKHL